MSSNVFKIDFVGGPFDGLSKESATIYGKTLWVPSLAAPVAESKAQGDATCEPQWARYAFSGGEYVFDAEGLPAVALLYQFERAFDGQRQAPAPQATHAGQQPIKRVNSP